MNTLLRKTAGTVLLLTGLAVGGFALLLAGSMVPDDWVLDELSGAFDDGVLGEKRPTSATGIAVPTEIDCTTLSYGSTSPAWVGLFKETAGAYTFTGCQALREQLERREAGLGFDPARKYMRYWHGSAVFAPAIVATGGVTGLRAVTQVVVLASFAVVGLFVSRTSGPKSAVAFLLPVFLTIPVETVSRSMPHGFSTSAALLGAVVVASKAGRGASLSHLWYFAVAAGAVFVYFDPLTAVPGFCALCMVLAGLAKTARGASKSEALQVISTVGAGWGAGYAGMWIAKWCIACIFFGFDRVWNNVYGQINFRLDGEHKKVVQGFGQASKANLETFLSRPFATTILLVGLLVAAAMLRRSTIDQVLTRVVLGVPLSLIPFWLEVLSNHSQIHTHFAYRSIAVGVGLLALLVTADLQHSNRVPKPSRVSLRKRIATTSRIQPT